ncbi:JmjC domain-containing protein [Sinorhizobium psoraleae]|uniref:JmjC domain-containing protein n=1 Tax=Sinorhizobium psoraleae TaxID=520838 RepID=A0ABT4KFD6_9HYPH|nr:cupin domain-containing protein [Sinorhizobium psoraleae]MCZ4090602.1 hypothetical protein [Sinorhizobium psoraleae]
MITPSVTEQLLSPLSIEEFGGGIFDLNYLLLAPNGTRFPFITAESIRYALTELDIPLSCIDLARDGAPIDKRMYGCGNFANRSRIWDLFSEGCTIIFRTADRWLPSLRTACADISDELGMRLQANIYLTPSSNYSSPPHFDPHHIFILQIEGQKKWEIYDGSYEKPRVQDRFDEGIHEVWHLKDELILSSGCLLYLPRGIIHKPISISDSIHVSLGFSRLCVSDCLAFLCGIAGEQSVDYRTHVVVEGDEEAIADQLSKQLSKYTTNLCDAKKFAAACGPACRSTRNECVLTFLAQTRIHQQFVTARQYGWSISKYLPSPTRPNLPSREKTHSLTSPLVLTQIMPLPHIPQRSGPVSAKV